MKEATGELNMTVITIIIIGAIIAFFWLFWDDITEAIQQQWETSTSSECPSGKVDSSGRCLPS